MIEHSRSISPQRRVCVSGAGLAGVALVVMLVGCSLSGGDGSESMPIGSNDHAAIVRASRAMVPTPPWPAGDQRGMANTLGVGTWMRCAYHLAQDKSRVYELSHLSTNDMPQSPWAVPLRYEYPPTAGFPGTVNAWHFGERVTGEPGAQGTQMDAFGHWGYLDAPWNGTDDFPVDSVKYYGGYTEQEVKPTPTSPLRKLGIDQAPPIITSAVLLDAKSHLGNGEPMIAGQQIHSDDIEAMLSAQGLIWRGLLPGDVLYIYTGWGDNWNKDYYYTGGPGLSYDAAKYLQRKRIVLVALDNPFTDAVNPGEFSGKVPPPPDTPLEILTPVHYHNLTQSGIHNIQNANLAALAADRVWTSCTTILPLRVEGGSGSPVRPIAIGVPGK